MVCEIDAVHVPHLPLVPVGGLINDKSFNEDLNKRVNLFKESDLEDFVDRLNGRELISVGLDADTGVEAEG